MGVLSFFGHKIFIIKDLNSVLMRSSLTSSEHLRFSILLYLSIGLSLSICHSTTKPLWRVSWPPLPFIKGY